MIVANMPTSEIPFGPPSANKSFTIRITDFRKRKLRIIRGIAINNAILLRNFLPKETSTFSFSFEDIILIITNGVRTNDVTPSRITKKAKTTKLGLRL